jgi:hypothetical protein
MALRCALSEQSLGRRIPDLAKLRDRIAAWENERNNRRAKSQLQFTNAGARIKMKRSYPDLQLLHGARHIRIINIAIFLSFLIIGNCLFYGKAFLVPCLGKYAAGVNEYLAYSKDIGTIEQGVLYQDIGFIHSAVQAADLVMFGNSRVQFGWDREELDSFCARNNISTYNLSCGNSEGYTFFFEYIKKHPIRNKVALLNIDNSIDIYSGPARQAIQGGGGKGPYLNFLESQSFIRIKSIFEVLFPEKMLHAVGYKPASMVLFRSFDNGFWNLKYFPGIEQTNQHCGVRNNRSLVVNYERSNLKKFVAALRANGCFVILTQVPWGDSDPVQVEDIADYEKLDFILFDRPYEVLYTFDGHHLCRQSAREFARDMLPRLLALVKRGENRFAEDKQLKEALRPRVD